MFAMKRKIQTIFLFLLIGVGCTIYGYFTYFQQPVYTFLHQDMHSQCILPDIDPNDPTILKFYGWHPPPLKCDPTPSLLVVDDSGYLRFNDSVYNPSKHGTIDCTYSTVSRLNDFNVTFKPEVTFTPPVDVPADAFLVRCRGKNGQVIYEKLEHKIHKIPKESIEQINDESDENLSIIMLGVDSMSRLAAFRKLPKTTQYLQETLGAYIFKGYNKVGDNTFPNILPMLTGKLEQFHSVDTETDFSDNYPLLFYDVQKAGYLTLYSEDWPEINSFSHSVRHGFEKEPVTHYGRNFWLAKRKHNPIEHNYELVLQFLEAQSLTLWKKSGFCYGNRPSHTLITGYLKQFIAAYKGKQKFAFAWLNEVGHNFVNFLEYADDDVFGLIKWMHLEGHLDKAVLIVYSDHGSRVDEIRNTYTGRIEDRMPFMSIVIPEVLKKKYPQLVTNIKANQHKLTTAMDIHETLDDILYKRYTDWENEFNISAISLQNFTRDDVTVMGVSLFKKVPEVRSCADAFIPEHYCACYTSQSVDVNEPIIRKAANFLLQNINDMLKEVIDSCAVLKVKSIMEARIVKNNLQRHAEKEKTFTLRNWIWSPEEHDDQRYLIVIVTSPGDATFEASILQSGGQLKILDKIIRTNLYGDQSKCVSKVELKDYCYCL